MAEQTTPAEAPPAQGEATAAPAAEAASAEAAETQTGAEQTEAPAEKPETAEPKPDPVAKSLEELAKQQQIVRKEREQLKREREAVERAKRLSELSKTDPLAYLRESGIDPNDVLQAFIAGDEQATEPEPQDPHVAKLAKELEEIKAERKRQEEAAKQAEQDRQYKQLTDSWLAQVKAAGEKFEIINSPVGERLDLGSQIVEVIEGHYQATGTILDIQVAAELVERQAEEWLRDVPRLRKFAPPTPTEIKSGSQTGSKATITNALAAPASPKSEERPKLSREESIARAVAKFAARKAASAA